ncbi:MAG: hypothetical protein Kow00128_10050 [Deltaproteobacteria bacterium]
MKKSVCLAVAALFLAVILGGCAQTGETLRRNPNAAIGAGAGVVGGAVIGGILGGKRGAVIGGLLGGLAGGAIGHYLDEQARDRADTNRAYAYSPSQGTRLEIESLRVNPAALAPGDTVNINLQYAVLTPNADDQILVRETRKILRGDQVVGETSIDISREGGTWRSTVPVTLPVQASTGNYRVIATVESRGVGRDVEETFFHVRP